MVTLNDGRSDPDGRTTLGTQDARQGMTTGHMRKVLMISIVLAVLALLAAWLWVAHPRSIAPNTARNAAQVPAGQSANGGVLSPQDTMAAPGAPTHVTPQADQPQTQN